MLSADEVRHVAMLARIALEAGEEEFYAGQLSSILAHIDRLRALDTEAIPPTAQAVPMANRMRADEPAGCLDQALATGNAPESRDGFFVVRAIQEPEP